MRQPMDIERITVRELRIPFKTAFKHAAAERRETQSVWVTVTRGKFTGYGEGCPREYVTGETMASATSFVHTVKDELAAGVPDLPSLRKWVTDHRSLIDRNPAAWCSVELAVLDLFAQEQACSPERLLGLGALGDEFRYTAVIGDSDPGAFKAQYGRYRRLGFRDFKLKLSGELERDQAKLEIIKASDPGSVRIRFDANNLWSRYARAEEYLKALDYPFFAIEEPLGVDRYDDLRKLASALNARIILDESFLRASQFAHLAGDPDSWLINLRVSKMGGLLRSLDIVEQARWRGIKLIVGAHVGETSVLTRAGLTIANDAHDILVAQEGAFGTWLLVRDVCEPSFQFGRNGILRPSDIGSRCAPHFD